MLINVETFRVARNLSRGTISSFNQIFTIIREDTRRCRRDFLDSPAERIVLETHCRGMHLGLFRLVLILEKAE